MCRLFCLCKLKPYDVLFTKSFEKKSCLNDLFIQTMCAIIDSVQLIVDNDIVEKSGIT